MRGVNIFQSKKPHKKVGKDQLSPGGCSSLINNGVEDMSTDVYVGVLLELHEEDGSSIVDGGHLPHLVQIERVTTPPYLCRYCPL